MVEGALVRALPELATVEVTGEERLSWLAGMLTQDVRHLEPGQGAYTLSVNQRGRLQAEAWVAVGVDRILIGVDRALAPSLCEALDRFLIMEDAAIQLVDDGRVWWLVHGPAAGAVAGRAAATGATTATARWGDIDTAIVVARPGAAPSLAEELTSVPGAVLATPTGWERIRIERLLPRFGVDFRLDMYPQEASLEHLGVSFHKGCYVGQEAVFMLNKRGHVNKRLVRLLLDASVPVARGDEITTPEGECVGNVTSAADTDGHSVALGMVKYKHTSSGTTLMVAGRPATVSCVAQRDDDCS